MLGRMVGDAGEHVGEPGLRVDIVEPSGLDQRVQDGGSVTTAVGAAEQPGFAAKRHTAQGTLGCIVRQTEPAVIEEAGERRPAAQHILAGLGEIMAARQLGELVLQPVVQVLHQRCAVFAAGGEEFVGVVFEDEDEDGSFMFEMAILAEDLP